ncbi:hypothetical protein N7457_001708 [Penicillium paradoxum]|uniref:uncharacterized protein n=1 Tax=Penicillium paradoxum TaxID=176176 RepID=UPI002548DB40|nr:uncharacterized protein N7457_001708 [Penicillium paradoxum]KAJ5795109.1 hypothetical protein N7457_001708 [Penicillium paradoxum]
MRFNTFALSALLAVSASALPLAKPDFQVVEETVWETVYETVWETAKPTLVPTVVPVEAVAVPSVTNAPSVPTVTSFSTAALPTITSIPTLSVPQPTAASSSSTLSPIPTSIVTPAGSGVSIVNNLSETIYLWVVSDQPGPMQTLASGETFSDTWLTNSNGGGISIKISTTEVCDSVLQFEYTQSGDILFWDLSSINMLKDSAFVDAGFAVTISDQSCPTATCAPGDAYCVESYQLPDDVNTLACGIDAAYTLTIG